MKKITTHFGEESFLSFYPSHLITLPFPSRDPKSNTFRRKYPEISGKRVDVTFMGSHGIPYGRLARDLMCLTSTRYIQQSNGSPAEAREIHFESYKEIMAEMQINRTGGSIRKDIMEQLNRLMYTTMDFDEFTMGRITQVGAKTKRQRGTTLRLFENRELIESGGMGNTITEVLLRIAPEYAKLLDDKVVPVDGKAYYSLSKLLEKDLYGYLVSKVWYLDRAHKEDISDSIDNLILHLTDVNEENIPGVRATYRDRIKDALVTITGEVYPKLRVEFDGEFLKVKRSPPHIEPGKQGAGYLLDTSY